MDLIALACNECGAPLRVESAARFVNCGHCGAQLEVRRDGASTWTAAVERLELAHDALSHRVDRLEGRRPRRRRFLRRGRDDEDAQPVGAVLGVVGFFGLVGLAVEMPRNAAIGIGVLLAFAAAVLLWRHFTDVKGREARAERRRARRRGAVTGNDGE